MVNSRRLGAAQLFLAAAQDAQLASADQLGQAVSELETGQPALRYFGRAESGRLENLFLSAPASTPRPGTNQIARRSEAFTAFIIQTEPRTKALELLRTSSSPLAKALGQFRAVTNTVLFSASASASGQALDAAIAICGLLADSGHFTPELNNEVLVLAANATSGRDPQPLEEILMDLLSLGHRFNWGQLTTLIQPIREPGTLRTLTRLLQKPGQRPVVFAAIGLSGDAAGVARYLSRFSDTGVNDLRASLRYNAGGVRELLHRQQRVCDSPLCLRNAGANGPGTLLGFAVQFSLANPRMALAGKWLLYLAGGFLLAAAFHFARRVSALEKPLEVRGFHVIREVLFALVVLVVVLLLSEPFLAQSNQKVELPFRLRLPMVGGASPAETPGAPSSIMNQVTLLTMLLFFVLQALLYVASLVKLAEIRRQRVLPRVKLKLLENEDHLFDAGLYLGFLGTIISLILVSLGVFKQPSLMAAYSSTSFGILFVVIFKILHLRPTRRQLLMAAESEAPEQVMVTAPATQSAPL